MSNYRREFFRYVEAGIVGLFFVQAIRFLYSTLYAHLGSLDQVTKTVNRAGLSGLAGVVSRADVQLELIFAVIALLLPLLAVILGRWRFGTLVAALVAAGRVYMTANGHTLIGVFGAALATGGAALYWAIIAQRRPQIFPAMMILGFAGDQLIRLYGFSIDPTWDSAFLPVQAIISLALFIIALINVALDAAERRRAEYQTPPRTQITGWGALALGGLLYLEFTLLGLPNTLAHRAGIDALNVAPWLVGATLLPLIPEVRDIARRFLGMFDGQWRGWVYFLLTGLLFVIGFRLNGVVSAAALIITQALISLAWWWIVQQTDRGGSFSGAAVAIGIALFLALTGAEYFTYDYAFVYNVPEPFGTALRALRGLGLGIVLLAGLFTHLPVILARKRLAWRGGRFVESALALLIVLMAVALAVTFTPPLVVTPTASADRLRIATLNLHGGYSLYFDSNLPDIAVQITKSGADVVLLQEVETGRLVSGSVDQAAWLGRALHMQVIFFPTNEALQGLAILTRLPVQTQQNVLLTSIGKQTGVQYVRLTAPDRAVLDIYNTELGYLLRDSTNSTQAQEQDQLTQLSQIFGLISQNDPTLTTRTLIGGTFNNTPSSDLYQRMFQAFADPFGGLASEKAITWRLVNNITSRVDYVWLRRITATSVGVVDMAATTHNMAVVEIGLLPTPG